LKVSLLPTNDGAEFPQNVNKNRTHYPIRQNKRVSPCEKRRESQLLWPTNVEKNY